MTLKKFNAFVRLRTVEKLLKVLEIIHLAKINQHLMTKTIDHLRLYIELLLIK